MSDETTNPADESTDHPQLQVTEPAVAEKFSAKMTELDLAAKEEAVAKQAADAGLPYIDLAKLAILPDAIGVIPEEQAVAAQALCFDRANDQLKVGVVDQAAALTVGLLNQLKDEGYQVSVYLISANSFAKARFFYKAVPKVLPVRLGVTITPEDLTKFQGQFTDFKDLAKKIRTISTTELVVLIIAAALDARASDIHLEAEEQGIMIRFRVDGILHEIVDLPKEAWHKLSSRIKLLARLKLNVADKPQDGGFTIDRPADKIDVRVSTIPTNYGESIVLRLLMSSSSAIEFDSLGLRGKAYTDLKREMTKPNGMIITTGPTGSGKTTTLYAMLHQLNKPEVKIITLEDPIEYKLEGVNQSQVKTGEGYTFAQGLRSILRQDPDVVMVGEIRDLDTADTAINAALTGHLVLSTLHTNSAAATIPRFLAMGVKPFLLAPALNAMIGQRLVRRICPDCKEPLQLDTQLLSEVMKTLSTLSAESGEHNRVNDAATLQFFHGKGCATCHGIGYQGRIGIYEIMTMTPAIEKLILSGQVSEYQMEELAVQEGMVTMVQDGLLKALDGLTTVEEVFRVAKE